MTTDDDIQDLNKKMDEVLKVIQGFGLEFIQNVGALKHNIMVLTDKVDNLNENMLYIKGLGVKIDEYGKFKQDIMTQIKRLESLIKVQQLSETSDPQLMDVKRTESIDSAKVLLANLEKEIGTYENIEKISRELERVKEEIFKITGGHKILFEINAFIRELKKEQNYDEKLIRNIKEKIVFWSNKLEN